MKTYLILSLFIMCIMVFFPMITFTVPTEDFSNTNRNEETNIQNEAFSDKIEVIRTSSGKVESVDIKKYIIGSVACEMPASFHEEALKAQAVACYTYLRWLEDNSDNMSGEIGDISDDSSKHQGYLNEEELKEKWGENYEKYYDKIEKIVSETYGQYIAYHNEPILSVFHAISPGVTNSAKDVWGSSVPYLLSVSAPGDKLSEKLECTYEFTADDLKDTLKNNDIEFNNDREMKITDIIRTESGYTTEIKINGVKYSGKEIRNIFSLKSPNFTVEVDKDIYIFKVYGIGHGVGMSQYSADFMARQGSNYKEILCHFYSGTELKTD